MPSKLTKHSIKIQALTDSRRSYFYNGYIYQGNETGGMGQTPSERELQVPSQVAIQLVKPIVNSERNITADNYYCSVELGLELAKRGLTLVDTLQKKKREIPPEFQALNRRPVQSFLFGFTQNMTHVSY
ncbi:uncharacterized protein LOC142317895 [Lycorma delicatula]|uniref:uncharacterized protein LOC142317894 n=1 Tax=Lycorma delicatula TaxID=130591 RepID=UPI003F514A36